MDFTQVKETVEFSSKDGSMSLNINAYLKNGWIMLSCCTHADEIDESQYTYVLLGWLGSDKAPHLNTDFRLDD